MRRVKVVEMFEKGSVTVILGDGFRSRLLALKLLLIDGRQCIICDRRRALCSYALVFAEFFCLGRTSDRRLITEELCDLADICPDGQNFIVIARKEFESFTQQEIDRLECRYIFSDEKNGILPCSKIHRA